jgi:hypothetical protein
VFLICFLKSRKRRATLRSLQYVMCIAHWASEGVFGNAYKLFGVSIEADDRKAP